MIKKKFEDRSVEVIDDIICNKCKDSLYKGGNYEGLQADLMGGYGSDIGDGVHIEFAMCETCLLELFKTFEIEPYREDFNH